MKKTNKTEDDGRQDQTAAELRDIKALFVLLLLKSGASQTEIAKGAWHHASDCKSAIQSWQCKATKRSDNQS
jgi:hypothetical protein